RALARTCGAQGPHGLPAAAALGGAAAAGGRGAGAGEPASARARGRADGEPRPPQRRSGAGSYQRGLPRGGRGVAARQPRPICPCPIQRGAATVTDQPRFNGAARFGRRRRGGPAMTLFGSLLGVARIVRRSLRQHALSTAVTVVSVALAS